MSGVLNSRGSKKFALDDLGFVFVHYHSKFSVEDPRRPYRLVWVSRGRIQESSCRGRREVWWMRVSRVVDSGGLCVFYLGGEVIGDGKRR
jgi:hypothetical protein